MNQLVNEAVKDYVERRSREVEHGLEATLAKLRAYRQRDPHFKEAIGALVDAEARLGVYSDRRRFSSHSESLATS